MTKSEGDDIDRLSGRLRMHNMDLSTVVARQAASALFQFIRSFGNRLIRSARTRPLTTLLVSFETGYAIGRMGRKHAQH
jgi:hypothetical protein